MVQIKNDEIIRVQQSGLIGSKIDAEALKCASFLYLEKVLT